MYLKYVLSVRMVKFALHYGKNFHKGNYKQGRLLRWQLQFGQYSFNCVFIKSDKNYFADTLTREWKTLAEPYNKKS